jgi:hypothetical protein
MIAFKTTFGWIHGLAWAYDFGVTGYIYSFLGFLLRRSLVVVMYVRIGLVVFRRTLRFRQKLVLFE